MLPRPPVFKFIRELPATIRLRLDFLASAVPIASMCFATSSSGVTLSATGVTEPETFARKINVRIMAASFIVLNGKNPQITRIEIRVICGPGIYLRSEVQLERELQNTRIVRLRNLSKGRAVDVLVKRTAADEEVRLVKDIERFSAELDVNRFGNPCSFDESHIKVPNSRTADRSQL